MRVRPLSCDAEDTWQPGNTLLNYIKMVRIFYITPVVRVRPFNSDGEATWQQDDSLFNYIKTVSIFTHVHSCSEGETFEL